MSFFFEMGLGLPKVVWKKLIYRKLIRTLLGLGAGTNCVYSEVFGIINKKLHISGYGGSVKVGVKQKTNLKWKKLLKKTKICALLS